MYRLGIGLEVVGPLIVVQVGVSAVPFEVMAIVPSF
jgi:hypothetical protein